MIKNSRRIPNGNFWSYDTVTSSVSDAVLLYKASVAAPR